MSKRNWACATCGMDSSRKESVKRHIKKLHSGNAIIVSYTDYLIGRQSGIYSPHSNPMYISKNEPSLADKVTEEYYKEIARQCARQLFLSNSLKRQQQISEPFGNNNSINIQHQPYDLRNNRDDIFGFEIKICNKCLAIAPVNVLFSQYINSAGRSFTHVCNLSRMKAISQTIINEEELANNLNRLVPMALRDYVNLWTNNKNMLIGIELPDVSPNGNNNIIDLTKRITLQRHDREGRGERKLTNFIALQFSAKRCLDVDLTNPNSNNNELYHKWAERVVKEKQTILNNEELMDFLEKVKDATFAFFRIEKQKGIRCYYFMAIIPATNNCNLKLFLDNQSNSIPLNQMQQQQKQQKVIPDNREEDDDIAEIAIKSHKGFFPRSLVSEYQVMQNLNNISNINNNNKNNNKNEPYQLNCTPVNKEDILDVDLSMKCLTTESQLDHSIANRVIDSGTVLNTPNDHHQPSQSKKKQCNDEDNILLQSWSSLA
jgi:hypothetical protein